MDRSCWPRRLVGFFLVCGALAVLQPAGGAAGAEPAMPRVRLLLEPEGNPPRILGEGTAINWDKPGLTLELLRLVGERIGVEFAYERVPWKRALYLLETDDADGLFHASFVPERQATMVYPMKAGQPDRSRAVFTQNYMLYVRAGTPVNWDGRVLSGKDVLVGVTSGYSVAAEVTKLGVPIEEAKTLQHNLDKLAAGHLSAYAGLEGMTDAVLAANPGRYGRIVKMERPLVSKPYYLVFGKAFYAGNRALAERIWDAIAELNASEAFAAIARRYGD